MTEHFTPTPMSEEEQATPFVPKRFVEDEDQPVTPENPLSGIELDILKVWLENSKDLRKIYKTDPLRVETAARAAYQQAWEQEVNLRNQGLTIDQAQEYTRPVMWTPPRLRTK